MTIESYPDEYLDVNFLIQTLYNFIHTKQVKEFLPDIDYKNIDITDIKLLLPIIQQTSLINNIFNTNVKFQYRHGNDYNFKRTFGVLSTDITISSYVGDKDSIIDSDNINSLMTWILSDLVIKGICTGILLNIMTVDLKISLLRPFIKIHPELISLDDKNDAEYLKCTINEHFYKKCILSFIINSMSEEELTSIIYQVIISIGQIQSIYPGFRHNFLITNNIHVYSKVPSMQQGLINGKLIEFNDTGHKVKITNFNKSIIVGLTDNDGLLPEQKVKDTKYDIVTFLKDIENIKNVSKIIKRL